jgi:flavin reductase (DIM6/NTAB) family NADH-FMN oxidoreductase RutF
VAPPRVAESAVAFECELFQTIDLGAPGHATLVLGRILRIHAYRAVLAPGSGTIDAAALQPVTRLGGSTYGALGDVFDIVRPVWANERGEIEGTLPALSSDGAEDQAPKL